MSLNLFQKYNPQTFAEVVGQDTTTSELQKRSQNDNFSKCIYLTGKTGIGKTAISRVIAKSILCQDKTDGTCCNKCNICVAIDNENTLLNYHEINASNCGIDQMRELEEQASKMIAFSESNRKVFYIDELQEMATKNKVAVKNLLKLLERKSKNNYFILGSMEDFHIPEAVRNRCTTYKLHPINDDAMFERLHYICEKENIEAEESKVIDALNIIIENSNGSLRTAISYLERIIYSELWESEERIVEELELISESKISKIVNALLIGKSKDINFYLLKKDVIEKVKDKLLLLYKASTNCYLNKKQISELSNYMETDINKIDFALNMLNELLKYVYTTQSLIDYYIVKILSHNKDKQVVRVPRKQKLQG